MSQTDRGSRVTNGESHRARALRLAAGTSTEGLAIVHALLAVEEQVRNVAYYAGQGGDVRRMDADDPRELASSSRDGVEAAFREERGA